MGTGNGNERNLLFLLFFLYFCFFSFFFSFPFPALEGKWEWEGAGIFPLPFLNSFLFGEKNERINWKKSKEVLPLFRPKFLSFFLLKALLIFSFSSFWGGEKDKGNCLVEDKRKMQEHSQRHFPGCRAVKVPILRSCGNDLATKFHYS